MTGPSRPGDHDTSTVAVAPSPLPVLEHRVRAMRRVWRGQVFTAFLLPVLFLVAMGVSVGGYVDRSGRLEVVYLDFIAPGVLAMNAVQIAVSEAMWPVMGGFQWNRTYHAMRASPLRPADIVGGELAYLAVRVGLPTATFVAVMALFGTVHSWWAVAVVPVCVLLAASLSGVVMAYSASIRSDNMFALPYRFLVIPMTLFAGAFFPVEAMPAFARWAAYVSPMWHGVELCRAATLGLPSALAPPAHLGYLALWALAGYVLARWRFAARLAD